MSDTGGDYTSKKDEPKKDEPKKGVDPGQITESVKNHYVWAAFSLVVLTAGVTWTANEAVRSKHVDAKNEIQTLKRDLAQAENENANLSQQIKSLKAKADSALDQAKELEKTSIDEKVVFNEDFTSLKPRFDDRQVTGVKQPVPLQTDGLLRLSTSSGTRRLIWDSCVPKMTNSRLVLGFNRINEVGPGNTAIIAGLTVDRDDITKKSIMFQISFDGELVVKSYNSGASVIHVEEQISLPKENSVCSLLLSEEGFEFQSVGYAGGFRRYREGFRLSDLRNSTFPFLQSSSQAESKSTTVFDCFRVERIGAE